MIENGYQHDRDVQSSRSLQLLWFNRGGLSVRWST